MKHLIFLLAVLFLAVSPAMAQTETQTVTVDYTWPMVAVTVLSVFAIGLSVYAAAVKGKSVADQDGMLPQLLLPILAVAGYLVNRTTWKGDNRLLKLFAEVSGYQVREEGSRLIIEPPPRETMENVAAQGFKPKPKTEWYKWHDGSVRPDPHPEGKSEPFDLPKDDSGVYG